MVRRYSKKKGPVRSKKVKHDGIQFASGLEKHMYIALKKAKIKAHYEGQTYELVPSFNFEQESYERQGNGKGEYRTETPELCVPRRFWFRACQDQRSHRLWRRQDEHRY